MPRGTSPSGPSRSRFHNPEQDHRPDERHQQAVRVEAGYAVPAEQSEDEPANHGANDPDDDVKQYALVGAHDQAGKPAGDRTEDNPPDDSHDSRLPSRRLSANTGRSTAAPPPVDPLQGSVP